MNSDNPYHPPAASVEAEASKSDDVWALVEPQKVSAGRGLSWIGEGFRSFSQNPGIWLAITIIYLLILMVSLFVPFATNILLPMLAGGLMLGIHNQDNGDSLEVKDLFEGFNTYAGQLAILGALIIGLTILYYIIIAVLALLGTVIVAVVEQNTDIGPIVIISMLVIGVPIMIGLTLIYMAVSWFGPPLIALHDLSVGEAFKMSLLGLKRNILPILICTFFMMLLTGVSLATGGLGFLIFIPVLMAASYASWKDVFTRVNVY